MSCDQAWVVGLPVDQRILSLVDDIQSAAARAEKLEAGDRSEIVRLEALLTKLEQIARSSGDAPRSAVPMPGAGDSMVVGPAPDYWPDAMSTAVREAFESHASSNRVPVLVVDAFAHGETPIADMGPADDVATVWVADEGVVGSRAVEARFRAQLAEATSNLTRRVPFSPSGVNNAVVAESLRDFTKAIPGSERVDAPVQYRDGSRSSYSFPLRSLALVEERGGASLELKCALLSIRHTEMDAVIDGAWLRNAEISRPRPAAQTDDLVYEISRKQLEELCNGQTHVRIDMYHTGLETAVVGFYRAVAMHLLEHPESLSVRPMYHVGNRAKPSRVGRRHRERPQERRIPIVSASSTFREGSLWSM